MRKTITFLIPLLILVAAVLPFTQSAARPASDTLLPRAYLPLVRKPEPPAWLGPDGGYIPAFAIDPQNPAVLYAGSWGAGVFKSTDGGATWNASSAGLGNLYINSLAVNPQDPSELYAGTYRGKLFKSVNAGANWYDTSAGIQDQAIVYSIAIDPIQPWNVYIATRGISNDGDKPWNGVVYFSRDRGATWYIGIRNMGGVDFQDWVYALQIDPINPANIFAASHEHGFYLTQQSGLSGTWTQRNEDLWDWAGRALAVNPVTPSKILYGSWHGGQVFRTTNTGINWQQSSTGLWGVKVYGMAQDPGNPNTSYIAAASNGIFKTVDGGLSWYSVGLGTLRHYIVQVDPKNGAVVYAGTIGDGVYKSLDGGGSWEQTIHGLRNAWTTGWVVSPDDPAVYYASTYGSGISYSLDGGGTWEGYNAGLADKMINRLVQRPDDAHVVFALTETAGLYRRSVGTDAAWAPVSGGLPEPASQTDLAQPSQPWETVDNPFLIPASSALAAPQVELASLLDLAFAPSNPQTAYLGTKGKGVYRSTDGGSTWGYPSRSSETIWALAVDPLNANHVYAASDSVGGLKVTLDGGSLWQDAGLSSRLVYALAYSSADPTVLYAGTSYGVYRLAAGQWTQVGGILAPVFTVATNPHIQGEVCVGTDAGAFCSFDDGHLWYPLPVSFSGLRILAISFDPLVPGRVYFSTQEKGALRFRFEP